MTTNVSEVFNKVLKGMRAMPVSGIVEYTFYKCNEYFVKRWDISRKRKELGKIWTIEADDHLEKQGDLSGNQVAILFDPTKYVYDVRSASRTNIGGESSGGRIYRVEIGDTVSCTCMMPELLHIPCSHIITACKERRVLFQSSPYMSSYYLLEAELKTWEPKFEPLLDPSLLLEYKGLHYVPDVAMRKSRKGRWKTKRFRNEMDDLEKGYGNDMYGTDDFNQKGTKVRCSLCHKEGHRIEKHKEGPSKEPKRKRPKRSVVVQVLCGPIILYNHFTITLKYD